MENHSEEVVRVQREEDVGKDADVVCGLRVGFRDASERRQPAGVERRPPLPQWKGPKPHVHAFALTAVVLVDTRDVAEGRVHRRQMVVFKEVLNQQFPVAVNLVPFERGDVIRCVGTSAEAESSSRLPPPRGC